MVVEILQKLSDSGISWKIENMLYETWFSLETQDEIKSKAFASMEEGVEYLRELAIEHYPNSTFADWWSEQLQTKRVCYGS